MPEVTGHTEQLGDQPVHWLSAPHHGVPTVYLHGVPEESGEWEPFLARTGGLAPDLPGFGTSGKRGDGDYTIEGYDAFLERWLEERGIDRLQLVVHDWGAVGLAFAQRFPERIERLVVINAVPFLPDYRWHRIARVWRTRGLGELSMGLTNRMTLKLASYESNVTPGPMPDDYLDRVSEHFDQGTQRAILSLYRSSPPEKLARAGERLGAISCPSLVVWGERDPYLPARFADAYAQALGNAKIVRLPDAGHWPWIDRPDVVETVTSFLTD
jgi:pimeloyl-ACP methyl ester carboxylesterase